MRWFVTALFVMGCGNTNPPISSSVPVRGEDFADGQGAVLLMHFRETAGATTFRDESGQGNDGTCTNCPASGYLGPVDQGAFFDGTNDVVTVPDDTSLDNTAAFTVATWFYPTLADTTGKAVVSKRVGTNNQCSYSLFFFTGAKLFVDVDGNGNRFSSNAVFGANDWYHVVLTFDGSLAAASRVSLYINGRLDRTATETSTTIPDYASDLTIGTLNTGDARYFRGIVDEVGVYNRAMRSDEVSSRYRLGALARGLKSLSPIALFDAVFGSFRRLAKGAHPVSG